MAELLIRAFTGGSYVKGDIICVNANGHVYGAEEGLPKFVIVKIPDLTIAQIVQYRQRWVRELEYEVLNHSGPTDTYEVRVYSTNPAVTGEGAITRVEIESYMNEWNVTVLSAAQNEVVIQFAIYDIIRSRHFYEKDERFDDVVFQELDYNVGAAIHTVQIDYSALGNQTTYVEHLIAFTLKATVISHVNKVIVAEFTRGTVLQRFKDMVIEKYRGQVLSRKYYFEESDVDSVIVQGGIVTITPVQLNNYVKSRAL